MTNIDSILNILGMTFVRKYVRLIIGTLHNLIEYDLVEDLPKIPQSSSLGLHFNRSPIKVKDIKKMYKNVYTPKIFRDLKMKVLNF